VIAEATHSRRTWITPHVLRYQCITNSQKGNVDRITAKRVAGDITDQMWSKYSHVRLDSTREKTAEAFQDIMPGTAIRFNPCQRGSIILRRNLGLLNQRECSRQALQLPCIAIAGTANQ
jgi:hypothetical protein